MRGIVAKHLYIEGRVQMVGFRYFTREMANREGVSGWVRNREDGGVEAYLEGLEDSVERVISFLHRGPKAAKVTRMEIEDKPLEDSKGFRVRY